MQRATGIEKEALAFIVFMAMLASLDLAWMRSGATNGTLDARAGFSAGLAVSELVIKPSTNKRAPKTIQVRTAKTVVKRPQPAAGGLAVFFAVRGSEYPPLKVTLIAVKQENRLEVWAAGTGGVPRYIMAYPICAMSGGYGPKLRRGDKQVPEGIYSVVGLNPYSRYHLSVRLNYPNAFDRDMARADGRTDLGGDIYIHGDCRSMGCLAMGNAAIEELYALVRDTGTANVSVIIAPWDLRKRPGDFTLRPGMPAWTTVLYENIGSAMARYNTDETRGIGLAMTDTRNYRLRPAPPVP